MILFPIQFIQFILKNELTNEKCFLNNYRQNSFSNFPLGKFDIVLLWETGSKNMIRKLNFNANKIFLFVFCYCQSKRPNCTIWLKIYSTLPYLLKGICSNYFKKTIICFINFNLLEPRNYISYNQFILTFNRNPESGINLYLS